MKRNQGSVPVSGAFPVDFFGNFYRLVTERKFFVSQEVNVLALTKGSERYVFLFNERNREELFRQFAKHACDQELSFTWYDAAVLSRKVRQDDSSKSVNLNSIDF